MNFLKFKKVLKRIEWYYNDIKWALNCPENLDYKVTNQEQFTIGITTFMDRFEACFKPLLRKLVSLFPDNQVIVTVNGHYKEKEQIEYISKIKEYCRNFNNVELIYFTTPKGLSFLWNTIIRNSSQSRMLLLNDDLNISLSLRPFILKSGILNQNICTINNSWSHYLITKNIADTIGLFDEKLEEFGGEDDDYSARLAVAGITLNNLTTNSIIKTWRKPVSHPRINSYGKDISLQRGGYSTLNTEYLESKWIMADEYFKGATIVPNRKNKYWKLR